MSDKYFLDSNILVYAHDRSAGEKQALAQRLIEHLWQSGEGVLNTQVLQEVCVSLRRKVSHPLATDEIRRLIQDYLSWEIIINDARSVVGALEIEEHYKISFWDGLILHAAETAGAAVLYSEDFASGQRYGSIRTVNPFEDKQR